MLKTFIISDKLFQGYTVVVDPCLFSSIKELCEYVKGHLKAIAIQNNLNIIVKKIEQLELHIHDLLFIDQVKDSKDDIIYLCSHC